MTVRRIISRERDSGSRRIDVPDSGGSTRNRSGIVPQVAADCIRWRPRALRRPSVSSEFRNMSRFQRLVETFRYQTVKAEYVLSPTGIMRSWFLLWTRLAVALTIPALVLLPLAVVMPRLTTSASYFLELARQLASLGMIVAAICFGLKLTFFLWKKFSKNINEHRE